MGVTTLESKFRIFDMRTQHPTVVIVAIIIVVVFIVSIIIVDIIAIVFVGGIQLSE